MIGIDQGGGFDTVATYAEQLAIPYPVLVDRRQVLSDLFGIEQLPFTIIVDRRGMVAKTIVGRCPSRKWRLKRPAPGSNGAAVVIGVLGGSSRRCGTALGYAR